jgi:hypothetical protein
VKTNNRTPFAAMTFASQSLTRTPFQTVVVKGTFDIEKDAPLRVTAEQEPMRVQEVPFAPAAPSSLRYEDDLAPFKPFADVVVIATAYAPGGKNAARWHAGVRVGPLEKRVLVTGPRAWVYTPLLGWALSPIVPVRSVPVRYELAFGGAGYEENPVGMGYVDPRKADRKQAIPTPQILPPECRDPVFGERIPVEGLSAVHRTWQPRRARAGTCAEVGSLDARVRLPPDFDPTFFNAAHFDLICDDFLRGGEQVCLDNLHPEHASLAFKLPALIVAAAIVDRSGFRYGGAARLDTLLIDAERMRAELTWRATLPLYEHGVARVDVGMREGLAVTLARAAEGGRQ